jgi:hypothetical protein
MLSLPFLAHLPTSGESIRFCRAIRTRRQAKLQIPSLSTSQLTAWSKSQSCSFVFTRSQNPHKSKDFLVDVADRLKEAQYATLWILRYEDFWDQTISSLDLLKILVIQAMQINPGALTAGPYPITVASIREANTEKDWLMILNRMLQGLPIVYIILDAEIVGYAMRYRTFETMRLMESLQRMITSTPVKVIISDTAIDENYATRKWESELWTRIFLDEIRDASKPGPMTSIPQRRIRRRRRM